MISSIFICMTVHLSMPKVDKMIPHNIHKVNPNLQFQTIKSNLEE